MASNSEYEQQRCFTKELTPFQKIWQEEIIRILNEREIQKSLPVKIFYSTYVLHPYFEKLKTK